MPIFFSHEIHEKNADMWMLTIIQHEQVKVFFIVDQIINWNTYINSFLCSNGFFLDISIQAGNYVLYIKVTHWISIIKLLIQFF